jgi:hypothetical protein
MLCGFHEVLHCGALPGYWGTPSDPLGEKVRLALERQDDADGEGEAQLSVMYLANGQVVDGTVSIPLDDGLDFALSILRLTAEGRGVSTAVLLDELTRAV